MFQALKNIGHAASTAVRSAIASISPTGSRSGSPVPSSFEAGDDDRADEPPNPAASLPSPMVLESLLLASGKENELLLEGAPVAVADASEKLFPRPPTEEKATADNGEDDDDDGGDENPDSAYFQRNYQWNVATLPHTHFDVSDDAIDVAALAFLCRRKKIPPSSRLHEGSLKKSGKVIHFSRQVYVPGREALELIACDGRNVWRGDLDFNLHNVARFHKGDTWDIDQFNTLLEDALCFPDEHPGLTYSLKCRGRGALYTRAAQPPAEEAEAEPAAETATTEAGGTDDVPPPGGARADRAQASVRWADNHQAADERKAGDDGDAADDDGEGGLYVANLLLEIRGSKELDDPPKNYLQNGCQLAVVPRDAENDVTAARFASTVSDLVLRRFCNLARAGNLRRAKRFRKRFGQWLDVEAVEADSGWAPLHYAAHTGQLLFMQWLVGTVGARPRALARDSKSALHIAVAAGHADVVRWLFSLDCGFALTDEYVEEELLLVQGVSRKSSKGARAGGRSVLSVMLERRRAGMLREYLGEESAVARAAYLAHGVRGWRVHDEAEVEFREAEAAAAKEAAEQAAAAQAEAAAKAAEEKASGSSKPGSKPGSRPTSAGTKKPDAAAPAGGAAVDEAAVAARPKRFGPMFFLLPKTAEELEEERREKEAAAAVKAAEAAAVAAAAAGEGEPSEFAAPDATAAAAACDAPSG